MTPRRYGPLAGRLHGNPGLDREETAPRHGRGGKHLDHRLCVTEGSGERPVGYRRAWCHGTPPRGWGRQKLTSTGTRYSPSKRNAAPHTR
jgi:hypothetical protein